MAVRAAKTATQTIPIVFARISDPIGLGFVAGLARPGGNLTGVSLQSLELANKRLEVLVTAVPSAKRVGVLWDPRLPSGRPELEETERAARFLKLDLVSAEVRGPGDLEPALRVMLEEHAGVLIVVTAPVFSEHVEQIIELANKARLPAMFFRRDQVAAGGLISYGPNRAEQFRRAAAFVDKIRATRDNGSGRRADARWRKSGKSTPATTQ